MWNEFEDTVFCNRLPQNTANNTDICLSEGVLTCCDIIPQNWSVNNIFSNKFVHVILCAVTCPGQFVVMNY